jgi:hypothetical protein
VPKLTDNERVKAMWELKSRLINAIERTPKGLTDYEIRQAILEVSIDLKILAKEKTGDTSISTVGTGEGRMP